jgi:hypothetical protein
MPSAFFVQGRSATARRLGSFRGDFQEVGVEAEVGSQLWVERRSQQSPLLISDWGAVLQAGQHLH